VNSELRIKENRIGSNIVGAIALASLSVYYFSYSFRPGSVVVKGSKGRLENISDFFRSQT